MIKAHKTDHQGRTKQKSILSPCYRSNLKRGKTVHISDENKWQRENQIPCPDALNGAQERERYRKERWQDDKLSLLKQPDMGVLHVDSGAQPLRVSRNIISEDYRPKPNKLNKYI